MTVSAIVRVAILCMVPVFATVGCAGRTRTSNDPVMTTESGSAMAGNLVDPGVVYRQMGLIATGNPLPYVGKVGYFATSLSDTTLVLTTVSIPNRALSFVREGDSYRASYEIRLRLMQGATEVRTANSLETVRVASFREVNRSDESVVFQKFFRVPPGQYTISVTIRDAGSNLSTTQDGAITVPRRAVGHLSTPLFVYEARPRTALDSVPRIVPSPRSSAVFGRDSSVSVYLEAYGTQPRLPVSFAVRNDRGAVTFRDTVVLQRRGNLLSGALRIPISRVGIGVATVTFARPDASDTVRTPVFVSFGNDIPLMSFEELLAQLRYYATSTRLGALRQTPVEQRPAAWAAFLRSSDPAPETPEHEGLQTYFTRVQQARLRFREDGPGRSGWLADRARVYVTLGEPDQVFEQSTNAPLSRSSISGRARIQYWEYGQYRVRLVFYDESAIGRWRLTPASESEFQNLTARLLVR